MFETLYKLEREICSLDAGRMTVRVEGTFIQEEVTRLLGKRKLAFQLKRQLEE